MSNQPYNKPQEPKMTNIFSLPNSFNPYQQQQQFYDQPSSSLNAFANQSPQHHLQQQQWSQQIPSVMPWSNQLNNCQQWNVNDYCFSFIGNNNQTNQQSLFPNNNNNDNINYMHGIKRDFSHLINDDQSDQTFDFDNNRPIKKYIGEDKVLEIFDRMHIREGEHYIVEDVKDDHSTNNSNVNIDDDQDKVQIEEIIDDNDSVNNNTIDDGENILEYSAELRDALASKPSSIIDKLITEEKEKLSKALVVWESNSLTKLLSSSITSNTNNDNLDSDDDSDEVAANKVQIDEPIDDEEMFDEGNDDGVDGENVIILDTTFPNENDNDEDLIME